MQAMQVIFSSPQENCGCYGHGNNQSVAKHMDTGTTQNIFKLACKNVIYEQVVYVIFCRRRMKIVVALGYNWLQKSNDSVKCK